MDIVSQGSTFLRRHDYEGHKKIKNKKEVHCTGNREFLSFFFSIPKLVLFIH